jgi:hypothetical protein
MTKNNNFNISEKTEERFGMCISIYRIAGVEILPHRYSKLYAIYALCASVCTYATLVAEILDVLQHTDDLQYFMDGIQTVGGAITAFWIYQFLRYCRSNISKSLSVCWISCFVMKLVDSHLPVCHTALRKRQIICNMVFTLKCITAAKRVEIEALISVHTIKFTLILD